MEKKEIEKKVLEYKNLEVERLNEQTKINSNERIAELNGMIEEMKYKQEKLETNLREETQPFTEKIAEIENRQAELKTKIADEWTLEEKTYKGILAVVTRKTYKPVIVVDKHNLVGCLLHHGKEDEGVKSFNLTLLRKMKELGMFPDDTVKLEEKYSVSIKLREVPIEVAEDDIEIMKEVEKEFGE